MAPYEGVASVVVEGFVQGLQMDWEGQYCPPYVGHWMKIVLVLKVVGKKPRCPLAIVHNMG